MPPGRPPSRTASAPARTCRTARCSAWPWRASSGVSAPWPGGWPGPPPRCRGRAAGLAGRGGPGSPVPRTVEAGAAAGGRAAVAGTAAEGEPASHKDEALLRLAPHLVLDGLQLAAEAVGAARAVLYVRRDLRASTRLDVQISERERRGLDRVAVEIVSAPTRFLAGEESALASLVSGGMAGPRFTPPRVFEPGVDGGPTPLPKLETLAPLAPPPRLPPRRCPAPGTPA